MTKCPHLCPNSHVVEFVRGLKVPELVGEESNIDCKPGTLHTTKREKERRRGRKGITKLFITVTNYTMYSLSIQVAMLSADSLCVCY